MTLHWDIFCRVIDNYGDIGVSWRLAKLLHHDHQQQVRLWLDQPQALAAMEPLYQPGLLQQHCQGIEIRHWQKDFEQTQPAEVVIETFGCELPRPYLDAMRALPATQRPIWINLEYLTAETWAVDFHLRPSKQACGLDKTFFFPGMQTGTGGLMREADYYRRQKKAPNSITLPNNQQLAEASINISVFAYKNSALQDLVNTLTKPGTPLPTGYQSVNLLIPEGRTLDGLATDIQQSLAKQACWQQGQLSLYRLPFMSQSDYDQLLWQADLNFVRGEESFVRAQWAAKPFIWHIYPTDDGAHWDKLQAFNDAYQAGLPHNLAHTISHWQQAWNQQQLDQQAWLQLIEHWPAWQQHAKTWPQKLGKLGELTSNLVKFVESKV
ncbi:elongation factor P maturation arginine rhamnosyltransferase EarP [Thiomicrospira sp. ALE5]|uniref:elongation factor P maturation arginine rhamnosyltransferase EarP n=1 Tax=Thiomicrospira sp. ALE5 TaxID=748650 RepID=UPI0008E7DD4F|nr:elongation factor P maturation arginine rhamnosyltransferase EarP [Thiomicrospira sp. ALE5]SFR49651.1 conserved hypothetical protein, PP_1857 family [Thiomicrospira sp. ALE5]